jgi:DNA-binding MarR family transcriptional regulator
MDQGRAFVARYMRVLSLQIMESGAEVCRELGTDLEPSWSSLLHQLGRHERVTVMDAAREIGVSHVHVQNLFKAMKKAGIVSTAADPNDGRRTFYRLTKKGCDLLPTVAHLNKAVEQVIADIEKETGDSLFEALRSFKSALGNKDWKTRVLEKMN